MGVYSIRQLQGVCDICEETFWPNAVDGADGWTLKSFKREMRRNGWKVSGRRATCPKCHAEKKGGE